MRTYLECFPCMVRQALDASRMATEDIFLQERILRQALKMVADMPLTMSPPHMGREIHAMIRRESGSPDPYRAIKDQYHRLALQALPRLEAIVAHADDPFGAAVRVAIAGNIIDFGAARQGEIDLGAVVERIEAEPLAVDHMEELRETFQQARTVLYLGDNAGETVFDRPLLKLMRDKHLTYAVRSAPVINDATLEDALAVGLDELADLIESGSDAPGTVWELCSPAFRQLFHRADLVISKGQGNYESLSDRVHRALFFLLKTKCSQVAEQFGCQIGGVIVDRSHTVQPDPHVKAAGNEPQSPPAAPTGEPG